MAPPIGALAFGYHAFGVSYRPPIGTVLSSAIVTYLLTLGGVYVLALIIDALAPNFGGASNQIQALKVAAYSQHGELGGRDLRADSPRSAGWGSWGCTASICCTWGCRC